MSLSDATRHFGDTNLGMQGHSFGPIQEFKIVPSTLLKDISHHECNLVGLSSEKNLISASNLAYCSVLSLLLRKTGLIHTRV